MSFSLLEVMGANPEILLILLVFLAGALIWMVINWRSQSRLASEEKATAERLRAEVEDLKVKKGMLETRANMLAKIEQDLTKSQQIRDALHKKMAGLQAELASSQATLNQERRSTSEKLTLLEESRVKLGKEFENLANRIFDEKAEKFTQHNRTNIDQSLNPLREQIQQFKAKVEDVYDRESKQRVSLLAEINHLKQLNHQISVDAVNLTRALKGEVKTQGNWGEVILEKVLEESGLRKGHEYETQVSLQTNDGGRRAPDVIVRLPDGKDIVIDAKVSLLDYERYCSATDEEMRQIALKAHSVSVKKHIRNLSTKAYEELDGVRSLDFVLMFVPIESAFLVAFQADPELFREAYDKNIIVVSPTTLLATLRAVQSIWRYERQNRNAEEIAARAGKLYDQIALIAESLQDVGRHLDRAKSSQVRTLNRLSEGRGNLIGQAQKLEELGARKRKQMPGQLLEGDDSDEAGYDDQSSNTEGEIPADIELGLDEALTDDSFAEETFDDD